MKTLQEALPDVVGSDPWQMPTAIDNGLGGLPGQRPAGDRGPGLPNGPLAGSIRDCRNQAANSFCPEQAFRLWKVF
jgi:hypothetical protein